MGDALAAGVEGLSSFAGPAAAEAAPLAEGLGTLGVDAADAGARGATSIADLVGTGTGLFGGTSGLEGTMLASGVSGADIASGAAFGTAAGGGALGTAEAFLGAPAASGFNPAALTPGIGAPGTGPGVLPPSTPAPQPSVAGGSDVFASGTSGVPGVNATGAPAATVAPGGASASSIAAPAGVSAPVDATAAAAPAASGATGAPAAAPASSSISDLLDKAGSGALKSLTSNPLGVALGAGGLGYNIWQGQKNTQNQDALKADAQTATANSNSMVASGEALQQYLASGTLPPGYQTQVDQAIKDAKTTAISNAAQQGQNTDPTQNTALATELARIDASKPQMQSQVASQLFSSGSTLLSAGQSAAGLSGSLYQALVNNDTTQAANAGKAIATLAAALSGKASNTVGGTNISVSPA